MTTLSDAGILILLLLGFGLLVAWWGIRSETVSPVSTPVESFTPVKESASTPIPENPESHPEEISKTEVSAEVPPPEDELPRSYDTPRGKYRRAYEADAQLPIAY